MELLDGMVEMDLTSATFAAAASDISKALDIGDIEHFSSCLRELMERDLVRKRSPQSIRDVTGYYVNVLGFERFLRELDPDGYVEPEERKTDWQAVAAGIEKLAPIAESDSLSQSEKAQAGAIITSLKILVEAPEPPKKCDPKFAV